MEAPTGGLRQAFIGTPAQVLLEVRIEVSIDPSMENKSLRGSYASSDEVFYERLGEICHESFCKASSRSSQRSSYTSFCESSQRSLPRGIPTSSHQSLFWILQE